jgi:hypothetical protein
MDRPTINARRGGSLRRSWGRWSVAVVVAAVALSTTAVLSTAAGAADSSAALPRATLAGPPTPGSGMGTQAALDNPKCRKTGSDGQPLASGYGRFDNAIQGGGPVCVKAWTGGDNGGATAPGVTKDKITVVAVVPNQQQLGATSAAAGGIPLDHATQEPGGTYADAVHDYLLSIMPFYETWGRDVEVKFLTSSGDDESSQRADAVQVKALKPFMVLDLDSSGLNILDQEIAKAKIVVTGFATTRDRALAQAPYRWGASDSQSAAINSAEVIGKQLAGKKAQFGGDDVKNQTRKFGAVYQDQLVDVNLLSKTLQKYGASLTSPNVYTGNGGPLGDPASAQQQAPTIVAKMKAAGVTTVVLFAERDMVTALMAQATQQDWHPEWFLTGALFAELTLFAHGYDQDQASHLFGIGSLYPYTKPDPNATGLTGAQLADALNWYWGLNGPGTMVGSVVPIPLLWMMAGIQYAGPDLTAKTFQQGQFAVPAQGGAASNSPNTFLAGHGRTPGLPYDEYMGNGSGGLDFAPLWYDPSTTGLGNQIGNEGKGVMWYVDGAKRYRAGTWPKQQFDWFNKSKSIIALEASQVPAAVAAASCTNCPATGASSPTVGVHGASSFVAKAGGGEVQS